MIKFLKINTVKITLFVKQQRYHYYEKVTFVPDVLVLQVEHIIREDYMVEAMEMIEMFCDLLLARFGLIEKMK